MNRLWPKVQSGLNRLQSGLLQSGFKLKVNCCTFASNAVGRCLEPILTEADVTAGRVGALAAVANARVFLALVDVVTTPAVHQQHVSRPELN